MNFIEHIKEQSRKVLEEIYQSTNYQPPVRQSTAKILKAISSISPYQAIEMTGRTSKHLQGQLMVFKTLKDYENFLNKWPHLSSWVRDDLNPGKGVGLIFISDSINSCWQRFVSIKEASHLILEGKYLDNPTDLGELSSVLTDVNTLPSDHPTEKGELFVRDVSGIFAAIEIFMPEESIKDWMEHKVNVEKQTPYQISKALMLPEKFVTIRMQQWELLS